MITLETLGNWLSRPCSSQTAISGFCIDTRKLNPGDIFIALSGENVDGHAFIKEAEQKGAAGIIAEKATFDLSIPQFLMDNVLQSLSRIARCHRQSFSLPVIALTGSNGKTSVKEMIAACLPQPSLATSGNLNNHIGVPLMVLKLQPEHRFAVFELGANHINEIAHTASICQPDVALINNIAPAHIEGFGSIDNVAKAKGEIYQSLPEQGLAIVNDDDHYAHFWNQDLHNKRVIRFSQKHRSDVYASAIHFDDSACARFMLSMPDRNPLEIALSIPGEHMISNALAAASCLFSVGIEDESIVRGLNQFRGVKGRQTILAGINHSRIIDDSYNANLRSVLTGIAVLARYPGRRILVLGDMGELGEHSASHHHQVGIAAKDAGIQKLYTIGTFSHLSSQAFGAGARHFQSREQLTETLKNELDAHSSVLIKGSRSAAMETIVAPLLAMATLNEG